MSTRSALAPDKHVRFADSTLALAGWVRSQVDTPKTIDELWTLARRRERGQSWTRRARFEDVATAVVVLFALGEVKEAGDDRVVRGRR